MEFIYLIILSAGVTGIIVYTIYSQSRTPKNSRPAKKTAKNLDLDFENDFLDEVNENFQGKVYTPSKQVQTQKSIKEYPDCFGTLEIHKTCKKNCSVSDECTSTVSILEGF